MNKIASLRQLKGRAVDGMEAILNAAAKENRDLNETELADYEAKKAEIKTLDAQIARLEEVDRLKAETSQPVAHGLTVEGPKREKGDALSRIVRSLAATKGDPARAAAHCEKVFRDAEIAKALAAGTGSAGGFVVPEDYSSEIVELLRPASVVRRMGARTMPMPHGNMTVPKITGGATAAYVAENTNITASQQTFGQLKLSAKKLAAITPISNDLIRFSSPSADSMVRGDLVSAIATAEDVSFIRGVQNGAGPKGLRYWAPSANVIAVNATVNLANVTADTSKLMLGLLNNNVRMIQPGWLMAPRIKVFLEDLRDGNGNKAFPEIANGTFRGYPIGVTTNIPINLAVTDTNESELYFVDFADVVIGDVPVMSIDVSSEAAYHDGGAVVAAFSLDQTVIRVIMENDLVVRHAESVAVLKDVDWGA